MTTMSRKQYDATLNEIHKLNAWAEDVTSNEEYEFRKAQIADRKAALHHKLDLIRARGKRKIVRWAID